jgi:hypothetical protein
MDDEMESSSSIEAPTRPAARVLTVVAIVLALSLISACGRDSSERREELATTPARRLVGIWDATLWLDRPIAPGTGHQPPRQVAGSMAFLEDHVGSLSPEELSNPTHVGVYDIDFRALGFQPRGPDGMPALVARTEASIAAPSASAPTGTPVSIVLDPGSTRFPLRLEGAIAGDSVSGTWTAGQSLGGGGRFTLQRHRSIP